MKPNMTTHQSTEVEAETVWPGKLAVLLPPFYEMISRKMLILMNNMWLIHCSFAPTFLCLSLDGKQKLALFAPTFLEIIFENTYFCCQLKWMNFYLSPHNFIIQHFIPSAAILIEKFYSGKNLGEFSNHILLLAVSN